MRMRQSVQDDYAVKKGFVCFPLCVCLCVQKHLTRAITNGKHKRTCTWQQTVVRISKISSDLAAFPPHGSMSIWCEFEGIKKLTWAQTF